MHQRKSWICKKLLTGRYFFVLLITILLCGQVSAHSGMVGGEKNLRVTKTKWFDIIYPARCEKSAAILYEKADEVYDEVTAQYGITPFFRMPLVITPAVDNYNAFWTAVPYNHIALYDTGYSGAGELALFSEKLLSTFRHELTHAVTYNMKNDFWKGVSKVLGDCIVPGMISVTTGMAEGATLTSESASGEGRLNDEYAKHYVKQAKLENQFPAYHDVSGASDISPSGAPYYFNGAFHQWLQDNYGMEAYSEFWYRVVNGKNITIAGAFKNSFGIKLQEAWLQFKNDYEVPDIPSNPVSAGIVQDFFEPEGCDYSRMNDAGSLYGSLTTSAQRLVWLDRFGGRVFTLNSETSPSSPAHTPSYTNSKSPAFRELFCLTGLTVLRLSNDGRFLAASYLSENSNGVKARVRLYDFERGAFYSVRHAGLKEAAVVKCGGDWYLVAQKYFDQQYSIVVYKIIMSADGRRVKDTQLFSEVLLGAETSSFAFTPLDKGNFAYIKQQGLLFSICVNSVEGSLIKEYPFPKGMTVRSLSYSSQDSGSLCFSYTKNGTMPRLGMLKTDGQIFLSPQDISGGVFEPVIFDGKVIYIGRFLRQNRILCMDMSYGESEVAGGNDAWRGYEPVNINDEPVSRTGESVNKDVSKSNSESPDITEKTTDIILKLPSTPYNPFPYLSRGLLVPLSNYKTAGIVSENVTSTFFNNFYPGISYITANPWADGSSDYYVLTAGWNFVTNTLGTSFTITKGTATNLLNTQTEIKSEFNSNGWKQGGIISTISSGIEVGNRSSISISNKASALFNYQGLYSLSEVAAIQFSTIKRAGPGRFERKGFSVSLSFGRFYEAYFPDTSPNKQNLHVVQDSTVLSSVFRLCIPHLLPFESKYGYTYNLPLTISAGLLPSSSIYGYNKFEKNVLKKEMGTPIFDVLVESTVFSIDIQKSIPVFTAFYLNDIYVALGYAATGTAGSASKNGFQTALLGEYFKALADGRGYYLDSIYLKAGLDFNPNIGALADASFKMKAYMLLSWAINSYKNLKPEERIKLSFGFNMNF